MVVKSDGAENATFYEYQRASSNVVAAKRL